MKFKVPYSIRKSLIKILPFVATAIMSTACHKEPYDVIIDWDWHNPPDKELIKKYANDKNVNTIILSLRPCSANSLSPNNFNRGRNYLEANCFSVNPNQIIGKGDIYVDPIGGASLPYPCGDTIQGMYAIDSSWYVSKGFNIVRGRPPINSSR